MSCSERKDRMGIDRPNVTSAEKPASRNAAAESNRLPIAAVPAGFCTCISMRSDLLDFGTAQEARRHENERDRENRDGGHILVVAREIGRPEHLHEAAEQP